MATKKEEFLIFLTPSYPVVFQYLLFLPFFTPMITFTLYSTYSSPGPERLIKIELASSHILTTG